MHKGRRRVFKHRRKPLPISRPTSGEANQGDVDAKEVESRKLSELGKCGCGKCGSDESLYIHSKCHTGTPTWAVISGDTITIECAECGTVIVRFRVSGIVGR
jgi:uncharacterized low-complexity protein